MNQNIWSGITTAVLATVIGTTTNLVCSYSQTIASNSNPEDNSVESQSSLTPTVLPSQTNHIWANSLENPIATIYPHEWQGKLAVTLRVRDIPVLTFLENGKPEKNLRNNSEGNKEITEEYLSQSESVKQAKSIASRLNQLHQENLDATQITVAWNAQTKTYDIKIKDEVLVRINQTIILPDTTNKKEVDALQATNRLRRLMGDAPPLSEIVGKTKTKSPPTQTATKLNPYKRGIASWYGPGFHGRRTANGERYNQNGLTAAHRYLPFGTKVRVTNLNNGRSVTVRINDRGPFIGGRIIDLSAGAAGAIGMFGSGIAPVSLEIID
ncbi:rare lipoprotein A [Gloeothece citriformis PCC 7424]|uniref:Probable endolytic peptidoglycan transglycosylase RlpA n=1 Tax=Gloeothece citriformis (strain PCC 7424) TaxID=65393 RepID=B7KJK9_GLOC7|nr:septal ring lytic transglycosylase RlpA family protein [Gloeothece citriformis]ACK73686.1 rare lipoprotein A [Gloeothece citriformis PCC 7424]